MYYVELDRRQGHGSEDCGHAETPFTDTKEKKKTWDENRPKAVGGAAAAGKVKVRLRSTKARMSKNPRQVWLPPDGDPEPCPTVRRRRGHLAKEICVPKVYANPGT